MIRRDQLEAIGLTSNGITRWVRGGRLVRRHRGVYLLGSGALEPWAAELAAVYALGEAAVASHRSAARLARMAAGPAGLPEITVARQNAARHRGIVVHRTRSLDAQDFTRIHGVPATTPARTAIDLTAALPTRDAERLIEHALAEKIVSRTALEDALARHPGRPGTPFIRAFLAAGREPQDLRSRAERLVRNLVRAAELPQPLANERVCGYLVDLVWLEQKVAIEFDSVAHHANEILFHRDRRKHSALAAAGFLLLPITWPRLTGHPHAVVAELASALANGR